MTRFMVPLMAVAVGVGTACSLILTFDEDERPCGPDEDPKDGLGDCSQDYTCMINVCIKNHSVTVGKTCTVNTHCKEGLVCTPPLFICSSQCDHPFGNGECSADQACVTMTDAGGVPVGACRGSNCTESPCAGAGTVCVGIKPGVGHCMDSCQLNWVGDTCRNDCGFGDDSKPRACQPVGPTRTLACVPEGDRNHGRGCNLHNAFCDDQHACIMPPDAEVGVCIKYCDPGAADPCAGLIDPSQSGVPATCNTIDAINAISVCGTLPANFLDAGSQGDPDGGDPGVAGG